MADNIRQYPGSLHGHTEYSNIRLRDCIIKIKDYIWHAAKLGHEVVGLTDHESLSGHLKALKVYKQVKEEYPNFKLILGNEIYLCRNGLNAENFNKEYDRYYHFILLAKDAIGHKQLREISTRAWERSYIARKMRRVPTYYSDLVEIIGANPGHIVGSTACLGGALATQLLRYRDNHSEELLTNIKLWLQQMVSLFGEGNFYLEMQPSDTQEQIYVNRYILNLSDELNIPYIITTDSHYLRKEDRGVHKAFLNAQDGDREVDAFYMTTHMMTTDELEGYFSYMTPEQLDEAYKNIRYIRDICQDYELEKPLKIPALQWKEPKLKVVNDKWFKVIPTLSKFVNSDYNGDNILARAIIEQIENRPEEFQNEQTYIAIEDNLQKTWASSEVNKTHWSAYFLNLQKIIDVCWDAGTLVGCGRGSGVGFILLYILGITQINPLREDVQTYSFRFLNPARVSVLDIDTDIEGGRRAAVLAKFREVYGQDRVANVATFRTEQTKSAILTAARGLGIDVDIAQYLASLIPADRNILRTLDQCMYGDEENDFPPIKQFVYEMTENYPELWQVAHNIEGIICGSGIHAGGVIFVDEPFTESTGLMRAPDGTICTQYELHDSEAVSLIKMDLLSVEAMDKMHICLDLLCDYGYIPRLGSLRETYENTIGIYNLERDNPDMWHMVWDHKIESLFQMEQQSGIQGIALTKPKNVADLAHLNSIIRLMAQEKGGEMPLNKYARFKENINLWYEEMDDYGLTQEEQKILEPIIKGSYGICESQEAFMQLVQIPECGGFDLNFADKLRKSIAKKNPKDFDALQVEYFKSIEEKGLSKNLCNYVWNVLVSTSKGYGFNLSHTLAYSLIALQEMNLAFKYPVIFWDCACLISDSGGDESNEDVTEDEDSVPECREEIGDHIIDFKEDEPEEEVVDIYEEEDYENYDYIDAPDKKTKVKKKKTKTTNYGKIASAIGKIKQVGITVSAPDINKSDYTFSPDVDNNRIRYGLKGITRIGDDLVSVILANRPYSSIADFLSKVKVNKPQMVNLIKSGAFDSFGDRIEIMHEYINSISDVKKRITLQNMAMLINFNLIPEEYELQVRTFNFNKYLKKRKMDSYYIDLDNIAFSFYSSFFDVDLLDCDTATESGFKIKQTTWEKIYQSQMDIIRPFVKSHAAELLKQVNDNLTKDMWDKYCLGSISKWEMESLSCYMHEHELAQVSDIYDFDDFERLPEEPEIDRYIPIKGKMVPILKLHRIIGTVLDREKSKKTVTLLTTSGVVTVKIFGAVFAQYDKQISERGADGKKHVVEKSMFSRGNKIIVTGVRDGDNFRAKKYSRTPYHLVEQITEVHDDGKICVQTRGEQE